MSDGAHRPAAVALVSLGCPKNLVDSEVMLGALQEAGHRLVADPREAEAVIVNTCAFIDTAREESVDTILALAELKRTGRCRVLAVAGCLSQRYREQLFRELPEVDLFVGTGEFSRLPELLASALTRTSADDLSGEPVPELQVSGAGQRAGRSIPGTGGMVKRALRRAQENGRVIAVGDPALHSYPAGLTNRVLLTPSYSAYLKIAEGCDHTCTFCVIPGIRGPYRSRPPAELIAEAEGLAERGVRELILVAQDTTRYGSDLPGRPRLAHLLRGLSAIDGLAWIRFLYAFPGRVDDELLSVMAETKKVCRYLDLPLQHADPEILRLMGRGGSGESFLLLLERIRAAVPGIAVRSSFIVGFPGEKQTHFRNLLAFLAEAKLDRVGVFAYSREEGSPAAALPEQVPQRVKEARCARLMERQAGISAGLNQAFIGRTVEALVEGPAPERPGWMMARTERDAPEIDGVIYLRPPAERERGGEGEQGDRGGGGENPPLIGHLVTALVEESDVHDLSGTVVDARKISRAGAQAPTRVIERVTERDAEKAPAETPLRAPAEVPGS
ncbi:MAG: 30S ribosomal protein S12 methylthiotransferase RimO [Firmicutes bacterium]|nr:30S ribosomal protein S12 methylthiotransferase RimO [Bacillota bacterium]